MNIYKFHTNPESLDHYNNIINDVQTTINTLIDLLHKIDYEFQRGSVKRGRYKPADGEKLQDLLDLAWEPTRILEYGILNEIKRKRIEQLYIDRIFDLVEDDSCITNDDEMYEMYQYIQSAIDDLEDLLQFTRGET